MTEHKRKLIKSHLKMKKCRYCKSKDNLTLDHKIPISRGGTDDIQNLQCLCADCNKVKSAIRDDEFRRIIKWYKNHQNLFKKYDKRTTTRTNR